MHRELFTDKYADDRPVGIAYRVGYLLLFMMLFLSSSYQALKIPVLGFLLIVLSLRLLMNHGRLRLKPELFFWYIALTVTGAISQAIGFYHDTPGFSETYRVYVLYPLIYILIVESVQSTRQLIGVFKVIILSGIVISLYILSFVLTKSGVLPDFMFISLGLNERIGFHEGYVGLNMDSLTSIIYFFPFLYTLMFLPGKEFKVTNFWRVGIVVGFLLVLLVSMLSGRRSLWVIMLLAVIIFFVLSKFVKKQTRRRGKNKIIKVFKKSIIALLLIVVSGFVAFQFDLSGQLILENIAKGFNSMEDHGASVRSDQFYALISGWIESPIWGAGHGASPDSMMSRIKPWAFELSYVALLYHAGLMGFFVYFSYIVWIFWKGFIIIRSSSVYGFFMLPVLIATFCFLVANSVNPYLEKFDFMWIVLFLPSVIINQYYFKEGRS